VSHRATFRLRRVAPALAVCAVAATAVVASAQGRGRGGGDVPWCFTPDECPRTAYDGRFTFVRVFFETRGGGGFGRSCGGGEPPWHHDRPYAERNLSSIIREVSTLPTFDGATGGNVFALDDPEIFRYPVLWVSEPGCWVPTDKQVSAFREYLLKGGFAIFDDFDGVEHMHNLLEQLQRILPELRPIQLTGEEPIFHSFFDIDLASLRMNQTDQTYWGLFEDNDITQRQLAIMNHNNDIGEFMDYSAVGWYPVDLTNEAYKLGVNYMIYAVSH
jgi:hypothetical protein